MPYPIARRTILPLLVRRTRIEGLENLPQRGPYIIAANHQSYTDAPQLAFPLIVQRNTKAWFLTTEHIWKTFSRIGGRWLLRWLGMIPIHDSSKGEVLAPAVDILERGGVIGIFPEGMRNLPKRNADWETVLLRGKTGAVRLALATGCPVIPAGIVAPAGITAWQAIRNFISRRQPAVVRYGTPIQWPRIDPSLVSKDELVKKTQELMTAIGRLCGKSYPD